MSNSFWMKSTFTSGEHIKNVFPSIHSLKLTANIIWTQEPWSVVRNLQKYAICDMLFQHGFAERVTRMLATRIHSRSFPNPSHHRRWICCSQRHLIPLSPVSRLDYASTISAQICDVYKPIPHTHACNTGVCVLRTSAMPTYPVQSISKRKLVVIVPNFF